MNYGLDEVYGWCRWKKIGMKKDVIWRIGIK